MPLEEGKLRLLLRPLLNARDGFIPSFREPNFDKSLFSFFLHELLLIYHFSLILNFSLNFFSHLSLLSLLFFLLDNWLDFFQIPISRLGCSKDLLFFFGTCYGNSFDSETCGSSYLLAVSPWFQILIEPLIWKFIFNFSSFIRTTYCVTLPLPKIVIFVNFINAIDNFIFKLGSLVVWKPLFGLDFLRF